MKRTLNSRIKKFKTTGSWSKQQQRQINAGRMIENWPGIESPKAGDIWANTPDVVRKELMNMMDVEFRKEGGLGIGQARLALADPGQVNKPVGGMQNVGIIHPDREIIRGAGHPAYRRGVPGEPLGVLKEQDIIAFELMVKEAQRRKIEDPRNFSQADRRILEVKSYPFQITEDVIRKIVESRND